jgi:hypothetical protein
MNDKRISREDVVSDEGNEALWQLVEGAAFYVSSITQQKSKEWGILGLGGGGYLLSCLGWQR